MIVTKEEFLNNISEKERTYYEENFSYFEKKSIREGRLIAHTADILLLIIRENGDKTPTVLVDLYNKINQHFDTEISILKERKEKLMSSRDA